MQLQQAEGLIMLCRNSVTLTPKTADCLVDFSNRNSLPGKCQRPIGTNLFCFNEAASYAIGVYMGSSRTRDRDVMIGSSLGRFTFT